MIQNYQKNYGDIIGFRGLQSFEDFEAQIHYQDLHKSLVCSHVLNTIQNIIQNMYIYVKPMYSIKFCIILKTYIHMQGPSCSTPTLTL